MCVKDFFNASLSGYIFVTIRRVNNDVDVGIKMALKPCTECKKEISDTASKCPNCGVKAPFVSSAEHKRVLKFWLLSGFVAATQNQK